MRNEDIHCLRQLRRAEPGARVGIVPAYCISRLIALGLILSYTSHIDITAKGEDILARRMVG